MYAGWFLSSKDGTHPNFCCFDGCFLNTTSQLILIVRIHLHLVICVFVLPRNMKRDLRMSIRDKPQSAADVSLA